MGVHLRGAFLMSRAAQKHMVDQQLRPDRQPVVELGAGQPRPGQLLRGQGRPAGLHQDAGHRARPVRHHRQRGRARVHRHRHDRGHRGPGRHGLRGLPEGGGRGQHPGAPGRPARGRRARRSRSWPARAPGSSPARSSTWRAGRCVDRGPGSGAAARGSADDLREQVRDFLAAHDPAGHATGSDFLRARFDAGLAWVHYPAGPRRPGPAPDPAAGRGRRVRRGGRADQPARAQRRSGSGMAAPDDPGVRHAGAESSAGCGRCGPARRSGASCSASRARAPTWPALATRAVTGRRASGWSTGRRCGRRRRTRPSWAPAGRPHRPGRAQARRG